ncbi:PGPGW domain-containing protein [Streptacidiphilus melanogenes]|uniref:PGPGW domain-containing protein n=1 Tax=Streptacidiphilus melanogenes TaxID=411235 RepID=UPI000A88B271|nr:PGPGW domain-containing protein [Streptacidiphilus melanogenes]
MRLLRRVLLAVAGVLLLVVGVALLVLPGPGMLLVFAGLTVLATVVPSLQRFVDPVRRRAMKAMADSVASPWRTAGTAALGVTLVVAGVLWGLVADLPFGGWAAGSSLLLSGLVVLGLLVYSLRQARDQGENRGTHEE